MTPTSCSDRARAWAAEDPDPQTRAELERPARRRAEAGDDAGAAAELADRFDGRLEFGTAGLRGALGAGPNRMNRVVVIRAAAGLAAYLLDAGRTRGGTVVIGYDARHNSDVFARGHRRGDGRRRAARPCVLPRPLPTPVLAYAIRRARLRRRRDGDRVAQPAAGQRLQGLPRRRQPDRAARGRRDLRARSTRSARWPTCRAATAGPGSARTSSSRYLDRVAGLVDPDGPRDLTIVYTPLHGVGGDDRRRGCSSGPASPAPHVAAAQAEPDPDFPTVAFPNPEEPGAMDLAMALAAEVGADLVVANDPDADRCAVAVPDAARLADAARRRGRRAARRLPARAPAREGVYASSIVSSSLLGKMAAAHGQPYAETLTGFKWIGRVEGLAFGYEEALGYCVDPGTGAATRTASRRCCWSCELAARLKAEGRTLVDLLDDIAREHGLHATDQLSVRVADLAADRRRDGRGCAPTPPTPLGGLRRRAGRRPRRGQRPTCRRPRGCATGSPSGARVVVRPVGHRAQAQVLPRGRRPGGRAEEDGVDAARISAAGRLDAIRGDLAAAAGSVGLALERTG